MATQTRTRQALDVLRALLEQIEPCDHCDSSGYEPHDETSACRICGGQGSTLDATGFISEIRDVLHDS